MYFKRMLTSLCLSLLAFCTFGQKSFNYLFEQGMEGYACFRIPALVTTAKGHLLAFAEARKGSCSDTGDIDLVMRRSTDNGKTWSKMQIIWDDRENVCGNPAPVLEERNGIVFLLMTWNLGSDHERDIIAGNSTDTRRIFITQSSDEGLTWSTPKEITSSTKKPNWTWYATGPCHGIQLTKRSGYRDRLVIPCDHIEADTKHYYSHTIYSDDLGETWKLSGSTPQHQVNECSIAETGDGALLLNMRNYDRTQKNRKLSHSTDGSMTWSALTDDSSLIEPICQASLIGNLKAGKKHRLYFSNPASQEKRERMTLRMSKDNGKTWHKSMLIHKGPSAYSDLVLLKGRKIGILYEGGQSSAYEGIAFEQFSLKDLE